jgi:aspartate kinase
MQTIALKFGGSSLASAQQYRKVAAIIHADPSRRYIIASAPGKRSSGDTKITDALYAVCREAQAGEDYEAALSMIADRYRDIADELGVRFDLDKELDIIRRHIKSGPERDYLASRGEYLGSRLLALYLEIPFVDAEGLVTFREDGSFDPDATNRLLGEALMGMQRAVIPGFYGSDAKGRIHTFSRGGSDVTGALVARAVRANLYENWTDVSGMLMADPRIVDSPAGIARISYRELRELSYMGATVLHEDAVFPVRSAGIPINIRNTNRPDDPGTMILPRLTMDASVRPITGVAGRCGFSTITIEKDLMNAEIGFGRKVLQVLEHYGISFEHLPSGIDTMTLVLNTEHLNEHRDAIMNEIHDAVHPDSLIVEDGLALVAVVGHGMVRSKGTAARVFEAIYRAGINIRMIDQGSSELNIILGVAETDYAASIRAIYQEFMGK